MNTKAFTIFALIALALADEKKPDHPNTRIACVTSNTLKPPRNCIECAYGVPGKCDKPFSSSNSNCYLSRSFSGGQCTVACKTPFTLDPKKRACIETKKEDMITGCRYYYRSKQGNVVCGACTNGAPNADLTKCEKLNIANCEVGSRSPLGQICVQPALNYVINFGLQKVSKQGPGQEGCMYLNGQGGCEGCKTYINYYSTRADKAKLNNICVYVPPPK